MADLRRPIYYWGCWEQAGHHLWSRHPGQPPHAALPRWLAQPWRTRLDAGLLAAIEPGPPVQLVYAQLDGWTAIAWWDRTVDDRPGSNSAFLAPELLSEDEILARAQVDWPEIFVRCGELR
jgi:hypothetical protein